MKKLSILLLVSGLCLASDAVAAQKSDALEILVGSAAGFAASKLPHSPLLLLAGVCLPRTVKELSTFPLNIEQEEVMCQQAPNSAASDRLEGLKILQGLQTKTDRLRVVNIAINTGLAGATWAGLAKLFGAEKATKGVCVAAVAAGTTLLVRDTLKHRRQTQELVAQAKSTSN